MNDGFAKADTKKIRQLADVAWERELGGELGKIASALDDMQSDRLTPFQVSDQIHEFHDGVSRDLYKQYSGSLPWTGVCRAYYDRVLTDADIVDASEEVQAGIRQFAASFAKLDAEAARSVT